MEMQMYVKIKAFPNRGSAFGFLLSRLLIIWLWAYLMKVIPETRRDIYVFIQIVMVNNSTK
jgi:hypothetical protein